MLVCASAGKADISNATTSHLLSLACILLNSRARAVVPEFPQITWASFQFNTEYASRLRRGRTSAGPVYVFVMGGYTGGELWVEGASGSEPCVLEKEGTKLVSVGHIGHTLYDRQIDVRNKDQLFHGIAHHILF